MALLWWNWNHRIVPTMPPRIGLSQDRPFQKLWLDIPAVISLHWFWYLWSSYQQPASLDSSSHSRCHYPETLILLLKEIKRNIIYRHALADCPMKNSRPPLPWFKLIYCWLLRKYVLSLNIKELLFRTCCGCSPTWRMPSLRTNLHNCAHMHIKIGHPNTCLILHTTSHKSLQPAGLSCGVKEKTIKINNIWNIIFHRPSVIGL
jgi:hypothetical protein